MKPWCPKLKPINVFLNRGTGHSMETISNPYINLYTTTTDSRSLPRGGGDGALGYLARGRLEEGGAGAGAGGEGAAVVDVGAELHEGGKRRL